MATRLTCESIWDSESRWMCGCGSAANDFDPFYDDSKIDRFYEWLYLNW